LPEKDEDGTSIQHDVRAPSSKFIRVYVHIFQQH
jgi:hypothetical protein